jgi:hypothetical protein
MRRSPVYYQLFGEALAQAVSVTTLVRLAYTYFVRRPARSMLSFGLDHGRYSSSGSRASRLQLYSIRSIWVRTLMLCRWSDAFSPYREWNMSS